MRTLHGRFRFEPGGEPVLDWVPWMKGGLEAMEAAIEPNRRVSEGSGSSAISALAAASRCDKDKIRPILERLKEKNVLIPEEVFTES